MKHIIMGVLLLSCIAIVHASDAPPPGFTLTIDGALAHNFLSNLLPMQADVQDAQQAHDFWLADLYFCGADQLGTSASALGIIYPGTAPKDSPQPMLIAPDCGRPLNGLATDLQDRILKHRTDLPPFIVAHINLVWKPWSLNFVVDRTAVVARKSGPSMSGSEQKAVSDLKKENRALEHLAAPLKTIDTTSIKANLGASDIPLRFSMAFDRDSAELKFFLEDGPASSLTEIQVPPTIDRMSPPANGLIRLPYDFSNLVSSKYFSGISYFKGTALDNFHGVYMDPPQLSGSQDSLTAKALVHLTDDLRSTYKMTVSWTGPDLALSTITAENVTLPPCPPLPGNGHIFPDCDHYLGIFRIVIPEAIEYILGKQKGELLRPSRYGDPSSWTIFGIPMSVRMEVVQISAQNNELDIKEIISLQKRLR